MEKSNHGGGQPSITFTIDGVEYTTDDRRQSAAELLQLAGLDPADHDLAILRGNSRDRLDDGKTIQLTPGARFVSIFCGATPVA